MAVIQFKKEKKKEKSEKYAFENVMISSVC